MKEPHFVPPADVAKVALQGLALRARQAPSRQCCTQSGLLTADYLARRRPMPLSRIAKMAAYFDRHEVDAQGAGWGTDSKGWQAWLLWGGTPGRRWARKIVGR